MRDVAGTPPSILLPPFGIATAAALVAGAMACLWLPGAIPIWASLLLLSIGSVAWTGRVPLRPRCIRFARHGNVLRIAGSFVVGFGMAGAQAQHALSMRLPQALERTEVTVTGRVVELPQRDVRLTRFLFRVDAGPGAAAPLKGRLLRLSWYDRNARERRSTSDFASATDDSDRTSRPAVRAGERWSLPVLLRAPRGLRNPGTFDGEKSALALRLSATGYVHAPDRAVRLAPPGGLHAWRESMSERIAGAVPADTSRFVRALAIGDTRALAERDWTLLRANGLTHLVAISGFHVGLVAGFFALMFRATWWCFPALARRCPARVAASTGAMAGAIAYAAVAGFALPTLRTALMIAVVTLACLARRPTRAGGTLAMAAIAVVLVDALSLLAPGFWLSFLGVAWLLWCLPRSAGDRPRRAIVTDFLSGQGIATLGLLPLTVVLFGQASLAGPLANLVAVPWWSLVVVPMSLAGLLLESVVPGSGAGCWRLAAVCFDLSWPLFEWLGDSPLAVHWLPEPRWFALPLALSGAVWLLLPRGVPGKPLALLLWCPLLWPDQRLPREGEAELTVIDVGQGLSVLVRTHGHALLYDMGPAVPDGFDAGERAVVPALRALGVQRLDRAVISHGDNDHAGGYDAVADAFPIHGTWAPTSLDSSIPLEACVENHAWTWDGVRFRFLHPPPQFPYLANESSCVLRVETRHGSALLTGDIGEVIERDLVRRHGPVLRSQVVMVAHHGSGHSSDAAFIAATSPRFALVSTGHGNRFGHPRPEVLTRWQRTGAMTLDTASGGALRVVLGADGVEIETRRGAQPHLWDAARPR